MVAAINLVRLTGGDELQAHHAADNACKENDLEGANLFSATGHGIDGGGDSADTNPNSVSRTDGNISQRPPQAAHADDNGNKEYNGGCEFGEALGTAHGRSPNGLEQTGNDQNSPRHGEISMRRLVVVRVRRISSGCLDGYTNHNNWEESGPSNMQDLRCWNATVESTLAWNGIAGSDVNNAGEYE